jgi:large subunit ribosomal protein L9
MQIILLERIEKLGTIGSVVNVKDGYARNYLLPNKKAMRATAENKAMFEAEKAKLMAKNEALKAAAEAESKKIEGAKVVIIRQAGDTGHLYGSVSSHDIAASLKDKGLTFTSPSTQIKIDKPIKDVGVYEVKVFLHPEVMNVLKVVVARSQEDADNIEKALAIAKEKAAKEKAAKKEAEALEVVAAPVVAAEEATNETEAAPVAEEKPARKPKAKKAE